MSKEYIIGDDMVVELYTAGNGKPCIAVREYFDSEEQEHDREISLWPDEMDALCKWWRNKKRSLGKSGDAK